MSHALSIIHAAVVIALATGNAACTDEMANDPVEDEGSADDSTAASLFVFHGRFRLFHGILSQEGDLSGSFRMARPSENQVETEITDVEYTFVLDKSDFHDAYTLVAVDSPQHSFAEWLDSGLQVFVEEDTALTEGSDASVFDAAPGERVQFKFFPVCSGDVLHCQPGKLSGFDFRGSPSDPFPTMPLQQIGEFELRRAR
jgi:hypothetical protein